MILIRNFFAVLPALLLAISSWATESTPPDVGKITHILDDLYRSSSSMGKVELIAKTETQKRHLKMRIWSKGKDRSLILIDEPVREAGTATLKVGNNLWNYLPKISRTIRIPPSMMLSSWMGTDFTNDDLVRDSSWEHDFSGKIQSPDPKGWWVLFEVKPGIVGRWQKVETLLSRDGFLPIQSKFYDRKGRLARIMMFEDVQTLGGRRIPTRLRLTSEDQPGHETELHYLEMKFDVNVPEATFSLSQLERS